MIDNAILQKPLIGVPERTLLTDEVISAFQQHAIEAYPKECLGYVKDGVYTRAENVAALPDRHAEFTPDMVLELMQEHVQLICHSHPNGPDCPSAQDMVTQRHLDLPFAIVSTDGTGALAPFVWGDNVEKPPLLGRPFRHGITDCYGLIRDYYRLVMGVSLEDYPRDWEWWADRNQPEDGLYEQNFRAWGFTEVDDLQPHDVVLLRAGARCVNHAGVYLGDHLILHHLAGRVEADHARVSVIEPLIRWRQGNRMAKTVRYRG